jgi:serine protease Do
MFGPFGATRESLIIAPDLQAFCANRLVKSALPHYRLTMSLKKYFTLQALLFCSLCLASADTIQLKDQATVTGKILTEKPDSVAVDVGYTVLVVPRNAIAGISKTSDVATQAGATASSLLNINAPTQFYHTAVRPAIARDVQDLVKQIGEAVVQVRTPGGLGSGFFINADGYLMTNFHVIQGETEISVEVYHRRDGQLDRKTYKQVRIIAINKFQDLALLKIEDKDAPKFKYVSLGNSDALNVGDSVFAIGSPMGLERTVTSGILSTKTRELEGELYLQTTAQINPGNSGGPLFDMSGEVIGVTNMKIMFGEGLGFAIPVELVKNFLDHRDAFAYSTDNPNNPFRYLEPPSRTKLKPEEK